MKYTHKSLCADLLALNAKLEKAGHALRLVGGHRYGYSAVDLATEDEAKSHCCQRMLCGGTPRECLAKAQAYVLQEVSPKHHDDRRLRDALANILVAGGANGADVPALLKIASDALTHSTTEGGAL